MEKPNKLKIIYMVAIPVIIIIFYIPVFLSKIYINTDEFSSIAAPAILSGHDWTPTVGFHSYHGIGQTIPLTPIFAAVGNGIIAHKILLLFTLLIKVLLGEILFSLFVDYIKSDITLALCLSMMYVCGSLGGDEYGLSALSEVPFAFCLAVGMFVWMKYKKSERAIYWILFVLLISYTYLIHSRCLILYIALSITAVIYIIRERLPYKEIIKKVTILLLGMAIAYIVLSVIQRQVYTVASGGELVNDPGMVLSASSYQFAKLLNWGNVLKIIKICLSLIATQCLISLGIGSTALACCIYVIYAELSGKEAFDKNIFYLSIISILCIIGMNFAIGIQSVGRVENGNYFWLTYIRYAEPFWILPYIVFAYMLQRPLLRRLKHTILIGTVFTGGIINLFLAQILSKGYGLAWSVLNRLFYSSQMDVRAYFVVFVKVMLISTITLNLTWDHKRFKKQIIFVLMVGMMTVDFQYEKYYVQKAREEYDTIDKSAEVIEWLTQFDPKVKINADANAIAYSSKLQYMVFDTTLYYAVNEKYFPDGNILFTNVANYSFNNPNVQMFQLDEGEYIYISDSSLYEVISSGKVH